jgi:hypothetical protein
MGETFTWLCKFWVIIQEMILGGFLFKHRAPPADAVYRKLLAWSDSLPQTVISTEGCPHHVLIAKCVFEPRLPSAQAHC